MKKQIITIGLAVLVAGSSAYGFGMKGGCENDSYDSHKRGMLLNSNKSSNSMYSLMSVISDLELSRTQQLDIRKIMFDLREENIQKMEDTHSFNVTFTKDGKFDKEEFVNNRIKLSKQMVEVQSKMIEKIFNILDDKQKNIVQNKLSLKRG
jgi:Spy/CpxP family protein refolding chaperone